MNNDNLIHDEIIELALPINPAYVSAARLTASSIANRMNYDIEDIEDIKTAVSEACTYLIRRSAKSMDGNGKFNIQFMLRSLELEIHFNCDISKNGELESDDEMGIIMIKALMDEVCLNSDSPYCIKITMKKTKKQVLHFE